MSTLIQEIIKQCDKPAVLENVHKQMCRAIDAPISVPMFLVSIAVAGATDVMVDAGFLAVAVLDEASKFHKVDLTQYKQTTLYKAAPEHRKHELDGFFADVVPGIQKMCEPLSSAFGIIVASTPNTGAVLTLVETWLIALDEKRTREPESLVAPVRGGIIPPVDPSAN